MSSLFPHPGPHLPSFRTILIKGPYHPSAPVHLCLSHTSQFKSSKHDHKAILLTPSRSALIHGLQEYNDDWITTRSGHGNVANISSRVQIFYPSSPSHLCLLLAMFRTSKTVVSPLFDAETTLDVAPTLVVLHEPSAYFLNDDPNSNLDLNFHTVSSYLSLISHIVASLSFLIESETGINFAFAVFDSRLDRLQLPIQNLPLARTHVLVDDEDNDHSSPRVQCVSIFAQKYFDWMVDFQPQGSQLPVTTDGSNGDDVGRTIRKRLRVYQLENGKVPLNSDGDMIHYEEHSWLETASGPVGGALFSWD